MKNAAILTAALALALSTQHTYVPFPEPTKLPPPPESMKHPTKENPYAFQRKESRRKRKVKKK